MPPKKKQTSRLRSSSQETKLNAECLPETQNRNCNLLEMEEISLEDNEAFAYETEVCEEMEFEEFKNEVSLSTNYLLIQDYLEFKAARSIQRFVRGWLYRIKYKRERSAAIRIQSEWRRFYCQRMYFRKYEDFLQQQIEQHFHQAAQKIQALWRGWWVRHHIHDHTRLMRLQLMAGEDLLYCVAFKLHHLLRTHQIPGVYSLRNSSAFSKVEQLLASLKFRTYNQRSIQVIEKSRRELNKARKQHMKSAYGTKVPFSGPDINNLCDMKCAPLYTAKDADFRIAKILQMYEETNREISKPNVLKKKSALSKQPSAPSSPSKSPSFWTDVVKSMKKWKIITENNVSVDPNIFKKPQNVDNFLKEMESEMSLMQGNCYCRREFLEDLNTNKVRYFPDKENIGEKQKSLTAKHVEQNSQITSKREQASLLGNLPPHSIISSVVLTIDDAKSYMKKANFKSSSISHAKRVSVADFSGESTTSDDLI